MDPENDILEQDPIIGDDDEEEDEEDQMDIDEGKKENQEGSDDDENMNEDEEEKDAKEDDDNDNNDDESNDNKVKDKNNGNNQNITGENKDVEPLLNENKVITGGEEDKTSKPMDKVHYYYLTMLQSAKIASGYNIYPTAAIPIQSHVNALTMSKGLKYMFVGGSDGYIRKYDFLNTVQGKLSLTIIQKHSLAESINNAGILTGYWENEIPQYKKNIKIKNKTDYEPLVSPVYSLAVEDECMYMLSGLKNGGITMQGVRYMEGSIVHYFKEHTQVVNILKLNNNQDKFLSGSWDKRILEWDLNAGGVVSNEFQGNSSEVSSIEYRPLFSNVKIDDIVKNFEPANDDMDDEMDSLFGEDEDEDRKEEGDLDDGRRQDKKKKEQDKNSDNNNKKLIEEISSTSLKIVYDEAVLMTASLNGTVNIWDSRATLKPVASLQRGPGTPPWCMSATWDSYTGDKIYVGRRNACVEEYDLKMITSLPSNIMKLPSISGPVSCVKSLPNGKHILIASRDNIRLFDTTLQSSSNINSSKSNSPFLIVPGHHGGMISQLYVDPTCRYLVSTSGDRGWQGQSTDVVLIYDVDLR